MKAKVLNFLCGILFLAGCSHHDVVAEKPSEAGEAVRSAADDESVPSGVYFRRHRLTAMKDGRLVFCAILSANRTGESEYKAVKNYLVIDHSSPDWSSVPQGDYYFLGYVVSDEEKRPDAVAAEKMTRFFNQRRSFSLWSSPHFLENSHRTEQEAAAEMRTSPICSGQAPLDKYGNLL